MTRSYSRAHNALNALCARDGGGCPNGPTFQNVAAKKQQMQGGAGQHFVPASLLPYGGFGDPDTPAPLWKAPRTVDQHKVALSQAQDRYMRALRAHILDLGLTDEEFEERLGYRRYGLTRKMNGSELMSMRDLVRINQEVPDILSAFGASDGSVPAVAEPRPPFKKSSSRTSDMATFIDTLNGAVQALDEANDVLDGIDSDQAARLGPILRSIGEVITEVGRSAQPTKSRNRRQPRR